MEERLFRVFSVSPPQWSSLYFRPCFVLTESSEELNDAAQNEKNKGNEAFRSGDLKEALIYYNRSISMQKNPAVYNNRAITHIKLNNFTQALDDCNFVISKEPNNVKGKQAWMLQPDIPVDECTFCITFSFKAEGYTGLESTLNHKGCLVVIFRLGHVVLFVTSLFNKYYSILVLVIAQPR